MYNAAIMVSNVEHFTYGTYCAAQYDTKGADVGQMEDQSREHVQICGVLAILLVSGTAFLLAYFSSTRCLHGCISKSPLTYGPVPMDQKYNEIS